jgi:hypothetical protein
MIRDLPTGVATSGPTAPVPKEPKPSIDRIDELASRILIGDILLPKFQRDFVWERKQIIKLLDSVGRGYPIGSILLWQSRRELRSERRIADLDIDLPRPDYPVNYLLDGQQRLSTICGVMFWGGDDPKSRWNIVYDLRAQKFLHLDSLEDPPLHQIRLNKLSDPSAFFSHVANLSMLEASDKDELKLRARDLFNRFKDYKIATVTLGDMSIEDVAPIFERINSTGTRLTIVDLMRAATWSPDFDLMDSITEILEDLSEEGFGGIDRKNVLRNISVAAGGGFSVESISTLRRHNTETLRSAVGACRESYEKVVDYLTTQIGVPNADIIPYSNQLTVLAEIFRQIPLPSAKQYQAISQWFWRTSLAGYFGGWDTGNMSEDQVAVTQFSNGIIENIAFSSDSKPISRIWKSKQFRSNNAHAKLLAIILAHTGPMDLLTNQKIDAVKSLSWTNAKEFHHIFPKAFLEKRGVSSNNINCLANFIMLTSASNKKILKKSPSNYFMEVAENAGVELEFLLNSNLISDLAFSAALEDDFERFIDLRAETIHNFVILKAGW